jgi:hypothetical protein
MASHERFDRRYANTLHACSMEELLAKQRAIMNDPANRNPDPHGLWLYAPAALGKLNAIAWAITARLAEKRRAEKEKEKAS